MHIWKASVNYQKHLPHHYLTWHTHWEQNLSSEAFLACKRSRKTPMRNIQLFSINISQEVSRNFLKFFKLHIIIATKHLSQKSTFPMTFPREDLWHICITMSLFQAGNHSHIEYSWAIFLLEWIVHPAQF